MCSPFQLNQPIAMDLRYPLCHVFGALPFNRNGQSRLLWLQFRLLLSYSWHSYFPPIPGQPLIAIYATVIHLMITVHTAYTINKKHGNKLRFPCVKNCKVHHISCWLKTCSALCAMHIASTPSKCSCMSSEVWKQHVMCTTKNALLHPPSITSTAPLCLLQLSLLH
jgi:hypothetical protein